MKGFFKAVAALALLMVAPAVATAQPKTTAAAPGVTREFLLGRWTDNNNCAEAVDFLADGRFVTTAGAEGRWTLVGNRLTFIGNSTVTAVLTATGRDAITLTHADGTVGHSTRCATPGSTARRTMPPLPATPAAVLSMSRPFARNYLVGRWTDDGDCGTVIEFRADGSFIIPNGGGRWRLEGERLSFIGERTITARARAVGNGRVLLIYDDNSLGQSIRC